MPADDSLVNSPADSPETDAVSAPPPAPVPRGSQIHAPDFSRRNFDLPELLDQPCTYAEWRRASLDLARLNRFTRAYQPTLAFLSRAVARTGVGHEPLHVLDVGCGHGDGLRAIYRWSRKRSLPLRLTGVDLNPYSARLARERDRTEFIPAGAITWVTADIFTWLPTRPADLIVSSLFAHHLSDADIVRFLHWCEAQARVGWFISDLARSERAARIFRWLARLVRLHPFLVHDGLISFQRALDRADWKRLLCEAGITSARIPEARRERLAVEQL